MITKEQLHQNAKAWQKEYYGYLNSYAKGVLFSSGSVGRSYYKELKPVFFEFLERLTPYQDVEGMRDLVIKTAIWPLSNYHSAASTHTRIEDFLTHVQKVFLAKFGDEKTADILRDIFPEIMFPKWPGNMTFANGSPFKGETFFTTY